MLKKPIGLMQDYYQQNVFGNDYPNIVILLSVTGTLYTIFANSCSPVGQLLASYVGATLSMTIGSLLMTVGLIFAGSSTQVQMGQILFDSLNQLN